MRGERYTPRKKSWAKDLLHAILATTAGTTGLEEALMGILGTK